MFPFSKFNNRIWFQSSLHRKATSAFHSDEELDGMCVVLGAAPSSGCSSSLGPAMLPGALQYRDVGLPYFCCQRKKREGRKKKGKKKKKKGIFIRLKKGREYSGYRLKNPENSENLDNF